MKSNEEKIEEIQRICESIVSYNPKNDPYFENRPCECEAELSKEILNIINKSSE
jgi:hypothetical protein